MSPLPCAKCGSEHLPEKMWEIEEQRDADKFQIPLGSVVCDDCWRSLGWYIYDSQKSN